MSAFPVVIVQQPGTQTLRTQGLPRVRRREPATVSPHPTPSPATRNRFELWTSGVHSRLSTAPGSRLPFQRRAQQDRSVWGNKYASSVGQSNCRQVVPIPRSGRPARVEIGPESIAVPTYPATTCPTSTHTGYIDCASRLWPVPLRHMQRSATSRQRWCTASNSGTLRSKLCTSLGTDEAVAVNPLDDTCTRYRSPTTRSPTSTAYASRRRHELLRISRGRSLSNRLSWWAIQHCTVQR